MTSEISAEQVAPPAGHAMARVAKGSLANLIGAAVTALCTFALTVVIARGLSRADAGVFFSTTSLFLVATSVGQLGTPTGIVYFLARARATDRSSAIGAYLRVALRPLTVTALVLAVATFVLAHQLAEWTVPSHVEDGTTYLRLLAVFVPFANLEAAWLAATRSFGSMRANNFIEQILRPLGQLALVAITVFLTSSALGVGLAWSIGYLPATVASWWAWRRLRPHPSRPAADEALPYGEFWKFSLPRALTAIIQMLIQRFDIVLVGALSGAVDAAVYAAATRFVVVGQLGIRAITLSTQPQLARDLAVDDHHAANRLYSMSTAWLMIVTWPLYLLLIIFGKPLLLVFGRGYSGGEVVLVIIAASMLLSTGLGMVDTVLSMAGRTSWNLANAVLALATNLGLDLWLIPEHGILGAAVGWAASIAVRNIAAASQVALAMRFSPFARCTAVAFTLAVACYFLLLGGCRLVVGDTPLGLAVGLVVSTACYLVGLVVLRSPLGLDALAGARRRRDWT